MSGSWPTADRLLLALVARARAEADTVMMGRTHSVHAEPTTLGLKLAGWAFEVDRGRTRLAAAVDEIGTGKISGPVGTYSHLGPDIEAEVLAALGLHADPVSTQIVQRDRHAALLTAIAVIGGSLERFATEVRNLQHTEIGELQEPFKPGQKGSSAMPHKRNPILSERVAGLARLLRGYAQTALEDQPLWHERDISHSSAERVILPDATIVLDYLLVRMTGLVEGLLVRSERMRENIDRGLGLHASSRVLVALVERGRAVARGSLRDRPAGRRCGPPTSGCRSAISSSVEPAVAQRLSLDRLDACFDDAAFLRHVPEVIARLDRLADAVRQRRAARARCPMLAEAYLRSGKVRDLYRLARRPARCSSPRTGFSAFDVVLPTEIPDKGRVLTGLSRFWFAETRVPLVPNHSALDRRRDDPALRGRIMICRRGRRHPDRGGRPRLPGGIGLEGVPGDRRRLRRSAAGRTARERPAAEPIFTPATKAELGEHDENIDFETMAGCVGRATAERVRELALALYAHAARASRNEPGSCSPTRSSSSASTRRRGRSSSSTRC